MSKHAENETENRRAEDSEAGLTDEFRKSLRRDLWLRVERLLRPPGSRARRAAAAERKSAS
jgi:hypothetical protein